MSATILDRRPAPADLRLVAALLAVLAAAWTLTGRRMAGMDAGPGGDLGGLGWFAISWLVMMAAMMLPALAPMLVAHRRRATSAGAAGGGTTAAFAAAYLLAWLAAGLAAYAAIEAVRSASPGFLGWDEAGRYVAAGVIAASAAYQLSPSKAACLRRCRERAAFLGERWRSGGPGAVRMGLEHGAWCIGCSWALMAALFALGAMSLTWMALLAAVIAAERVLPAVRPSAAVLLVALALGVALAPADVPALTLPQGGMGMAR